MVIDVVSDLLPDSFERHTSIATSSRGSGACFITGRRSSSLSLIWHMFTTGQIFVLRVVTIAIGSMGRSEAVLATIHQFLVRECNSELRTTLFFEQQPRLLRVGCNMNRDVKLQSAVLVVFVLSLTGALFAQRTADKKLIVNGKTTSAAILQVDGHSYVDIEILAKIINGSVTFEPNQIVLTIPSANSDAASPQSAQGLSKDFASASIVALAEMKEWKGALGAMLTFGLAVDGTWAQAYQDRVRTSLAQANVAASTNSDHNALQLLSTQFANLAKWQSDVVAERQALNGARTLEPNALQNDPVLAKFSNCGKFLSTMLVSGDFSDNSSCD